MSVIPTARHIAEAESELGKRIADGERVLEPGRGEHGDWPYLPQHVDALSRAWPQARETSDPELCPAWTLLLAGCDKGLVEVDPN